MSLAARCRSLLDSILRRGRLEQEMDAELRFHIVARSEELVRGGMPRQQAERTARVEFGSPDAVKDDCRRALGLRLVDAVTGKHHLRNSLRGFRRTPGFAVFTIAVLALGIGANTAVFSLVHAVLLKALPYRQADRLVWAWSIRPDGAKKPFNAADVVDYRDRNRALESVAAFTELGATVTGHGEPVSLVGLRISANAFRTLGAGAALGRTLEPSDDAPNAPAVLVLSYAAWRNRFGADPDIIGRKLVLNGLPYVIVGVLPGEFLFPKTTAEFAVPLALDSDPSRALRNSTSFLRLIGRLRTGFTREQAQEDLSSIARELRRAYPESNAQRVAVGLEPMENEILGPARDSFGIILAAVALVLLAVSVNVANSLVARMVRRRTEIAIRAAMGATRLHVVAQLLAENLMLTAFGGLLGIAVAKAAIHLLPLYNPMTFPRIEWAAVDGPAIVFAAVLSVALGIAISLAPARQWAASIADDLKAGGRGTTEGRQTRATQMALIVAEVALSFALLAGAGQLSRSLVRLQRVDPGFDAHRVLAVRVSLPRARYGDPRSIKLFLDRAVQAIETDPVVESHSAISVLPLSGGMSTVPFIVASRPPSARDQRPSANYRAIAPRYFATMGIPILEGTEFSDADRAGTRAVAIVNRQFARRFLGGLQATGTRLRIDDTDNGEREAVIVAVVGDVKQNSLDDEPAPDLYVPIEQLPKENTRFVTNGMTLVLRCRTEPRQIGGAVKGRVLAAEPEAALTPRAMDELLAASLATRRFQTLLMNLFGAFAAFLAGFGLYACMSCLTSERHHEIGVRLAVGATRTEIAGLVMKQGLTLAACGTAVGIALALLGHRLLSGLLFGTGPFDAIALGTAAGGVFAIAAAASWLPAVRAARIDPVTMLRR